MNARAIGRHWLSGLSGVIQGEGMSCGKAAWLVLWDHSSKSTWVEKELVEVQS